MILVFHRLQVTNFIVTVIKIQFTVNKLIRMYWLRRIMNLGNFVLSFCCPLLWSIKAFGGIVVLKIFICIFIFISSSLYRIVTVITVASIFLGPIEFLDGRFYGFQNTVSILAYLSPKSRRFFVKCFALQSKLKFCRHEGWKLTFQCRWYQVILLLIWELFGLFAAMWHFWVEGRNVIN